MLDVHPPHGSTRSWKDFFVHLATIVIGLLIAVGLEQTVELIHHRNQRIDLEEQMRDVLKQDREFIARDTEQFNRFREYLLGIQSAISARLKGQAPSQPPRIDPRTAFVTPMPNLAPYQAAKENGTVALLDSNRIRLYNRVAFQRDLMQAAMDRWVGSLALMDAFRKRYDVSQDTRVFGQPVAAADVTKLTLTELTEYRSILGTVIDATDQLVGRFHLMDVMVHAILDGTEDESGLLLQVERGMGIHVRTNESPARVN